MDHLVEPHGGELVELLVDDERAAGLKFASRECIYDSEMIPKASRQNKVSNFNWMWY